MERLTHCYTVLNLVFLILSTPSINGQDIRYKELEKDYKNTLNNARIDITGIVTDTEDVRLDNVQSKVERGYHDEKNFYILRIIFLLI